MKIKLVPELSERRTTVIRTFGSLSSGFSARIAGSFHAVILPRKMSASVLRSSRSAFGFTPRRVAAGWFLTVLLVWGVLLLVRVFKPIPAVRIGIAVLAVSFVVLGCTDPDRRIAEATLTRWEQGIDPMLDTGVLSACGATQYSGEEKEPLLMSTTTRLVQDGWFIGRSLDDIYQLYYFDRDNQTVYTTQLDATHTLRLTVQGNTCTAAELLTA